MHFPESDICDGLEWTCSPFKVPDDSIHDDEYIDKEKCISLGTNALLKMQFASFWIDLLPTYEVFSHRELLVNTQFTTASVCGSGFSFILGMKMKSLSRLNVSSDARFGFSAHPLELKDLPIKCNRKCHINFCCVCILILEVWQISHFIMHWKIFPKRLIISCIYRAFLLYMVYSCFISDTYLANRKWPTFILG